MVASGSTTMHTCIYCKRFTLFDECETEILKNYRFGILLVNEKNSEKSVVELN